MPTMVQRPIALSISRRATAIHRVEGVAACAGLIPMETRGDRGIATPALTIIVLRLEQAKPLRDHILSAFSRSLLPC